MEYIIITVKDGCVQGIDSNFEQGDVEIAVLDLDGGAGVAVSEAPLISELDFQKCCDNIRKSYEY